MYREDAVGSIREGKMGSLLAGSWCEAREDMDISAFDELPDHLVLQILNLVKDARSLSRCRPVCRRFNALVSHAECLLIQVDAVIGTQPSMPCSGYVPLLGRLLRSALQSLSVFFAPKNAFVAPLWRSPADLIQGFPRIRQLEIELPGRDSPLEKGAVVRWKAESGKLLRRCVILTARRVIFPSADSSSDCEENDDKTEEVTQEIKENVVQTIGVLISASARHYVVKDVIRERRKICGELKDLDSMVVRDRDGVGTLVMNREGLLECTHGSSQADNEEGRTGRQRTEVPAVSMKMRCARQVDLGDGARLERATLVVVRAAESNVGVGAPGKEEEEEEEMEAEKWAAVAFEGWLRCAAQLLLRKPGINLEMNAF